MAEMKYLFLTGFLMVSGFAVAGELPAGAVGDSMVVDGETLPIERPGSWFVGDIQRVISISSVSERCEITPVRMVYEDSRQKKHVLEYSVMGNGCN